MIPSTRLARTAALSAAAVGLTLFASAVPAAAVAPPLSDPHVLVHLDITKGQMPENITLEPDGSADVTLTGGRQIARIGLNGHTQILATLPERPAGATTPVVGTPLLGGIVRDHDGTLYVSYATGTADLTGIWRLAPGGTPERIAALPADGLPNGLALDHHTGTLYSADSALGTIWRVPIHGGKPTEWAKGTELNPAGFIGANGIKVHRGAVWVSNYDRGTVVRIPLRGHGSAGPIQIKAAGLGAGLDDFAFTGHRDDFLIARNPANEVAFVTSGGKHKIVLTQADGLSNPTSVAVRKGTVYAPSAAYTTQKDPNLLLARINK